MNSALLAALIVIGVVVGIGLLSLIRKEFWEVGCSWLALLVFVIAPILLMIVGAATTSFGLMILAEVLTCIGSRAMIESKVAQVSGVLVALVPLVPTVIFLVICIAFNIVAGAVILTVVGLLQFFTVIVEL